MAHCTPLEAGAHSQGTASLGPVALGQGHHQRLFRPGQSVPDHPHLLPVAEVERQTEHFFSKMKISRGYKNEIAVKSCLVRQFPLGYFVMTIHFDILKTKQSKVLHQFTDG